MILSIFYINPTKIYIKEILVKELNIIFSERQLKLLSFLLSEKKWVNSSILAQHLNVSNKTIQKEVVNINIFLGEKGKIESNNRKGYYFLMEDEELLNSIIKDDEKQIEKEMANGRTKLFIMLLLFEEDYISMNKIAERLYLSKSTVNVEIQKMKRVVNRVPGYSLEISPSKGIFIHANEVLKRFMLTKSFDIQVDYAKILRDRTFKNIDEMYKKTYNFLKDILVENNYIISGSTFRQFQIFIIICILRQKKGFYIERQSNHTLNRITLAIGKRIKTDLNYELNSDELNVIQLYLAERNILQKRNDNNEEIKEKLKIFYRKVKNDLGLELNIDEMTNRILVQHIEKMILRIERSHFIINDFTKEIFQKYPLETHIVKIYLQSCLNTTIPDSEIGYIIVYLASILENYYKKLSIVLISNTELSFLSNIQNIIKSKLGQNISIIETVPLYLYESKKEEYDSKFEFFITTEKEMIFKDNRFIYINSIPHKHEINKLAEQIEQFNNKNQKQKLAMLYEKYCFPNNIILLETKQNDINDILKNQNIILNENTCFTILHNGILLISMFELQNTKSEIKQISLKYSIKFNEKKILKIIFVKFSLEEKILDFYNLIKEIL